MTAEQTLDPMTTDIESDRRIFQDAIENGSKQAGLTGLMLIAELESAQRRLAWYALLAGGASSGRVSWNENYLWIDFNKESEEYFPITLDDNGLPVESVELRRAVEAVLEATNQTGG